MCDDRTETERRRVLVTGPAGIESAEFSIHAAVLEPGPPVFPVELRIGDEVLSGRRFDYVDSLDVIRGVLESQAETFAASALIGTWPTPE